MSEIIYPNKNAHIIVVGNEKGGAGKTTVTMHVAMSLLHDGYRVSTIDIDSRQRSLSNYIENRRNFAAKVKQDLLMPSHFIVNRSKLDSSREAKIDEESRFSEYLEKAARRSDFVVVDCPGNDTYLARSAHSYADTLITPMNDSFIDLSVLARVGDDDFKVERHGVYSEMVWEGKLNRAKRDRGEIDWVIMRNRLSNIAARNKNNMSEALQNLSRRIGARVADGLSERVIYRELFLKGLTLLDIIEGNLVNLSVGHVTARQELREFMNFLDLKTKIINKGVTSVEKQAQQAIAQQEQAAEAQQAEEAQIEEVLEKEAAFA